MRYERLYLASFVLGLIVSAMSWPQRTALVAANPVLAQVGEPKYTPSQSAKDGVVGAGGTQTWTFQATNKGETVLRMEYRRPWSMQTPAVQTLDYPVKVD